MICPKCGKEVRAGAKFCGYCGAPLTASAAAVPTRGRSKHKKVLLLAIPLILVLIAGAAFILNRTHSEGTAVDASSDYVVVYADNSYTLIPLNNKYEKVPLGTIVYGDGNDYIPDVVFSPDGKYVFFYTTDTNGKNITLCRAECSKLTTDLKKNQRLYTTVSTDQFYYDLAPMENGILLLYSEGTGQSSYFDGSKTTELPEDWSSITFDAAGNYVYWSDDVIWRVSGGDLSAARQIDTGIDRSSVYFLDSEDLLYQKDNTVYQIDSNGTPHSIAEGFSIIYGSDDAVYYLGGPEGSFELFCWKDGSASLVADQIMWYSYDQDTQDSKLLQYSTPDSDILFDLSSGQYAVITEAAEASLERCALESGVSDRPETSLFIIDSYFYVVCDDAFFASALTDHVMGDFEQICTGVYPLTQVGDTIYCTEYRIDPDNAYDFDTIDLYAVKDGGMYLVAPMIFPTTLNIYADGVMISEGAGTHGPVWGRAKEGSANLPNALYVTNYLGNEQFIYKTEDELYFYDAHSAEPVKLFDDPRCVWCSGSRDFDFTLGIYD